MAYILKCVKNAGITVQVVEITLNFRIFLCQFSPFWPCFDLIVESSARALYGYALAVSHQAVICWDMSEFDAILYQCLGGV